MVDSGTRTLGSWELGQDGMRKLTRRPQNHFWWILRQIIPSDESDKTLVF